jgi:PIN domain
MCQVVIDTNVVAAALLSNRGASHRLLRLVGDDRWRINLSVPLVFEYEQTLKRVWAEISVVAISIAWCTLYAPTRVCDRSFLATIPSRPQG